MGEKPTEKPKTPSTVPELQVKNVFETLVDLGQKHLRIVSVGTEHGDITRPFPGRIQIERDIRTAFGDRISGLSLDGFNKLLPIVADERRITSILSHPESADNFWSWGIRYAYTSGAPLLITDPLYNARGLSRLIAGADAMPTAVADREYKAAELRNLAKLKNIEAKKTGPQILTGGALALMGLRIFAGLLSMDKMGRRAFLSQFRSGAVASGAILLGYTEAMGNISTQMLDFMATLPDDRYLTALVQESRALTDADYNDPRFAKWAEYVSKAKQATAVWRNAVTAEILSSVPAELLKLYEDAKTNRKAANLVNVWGHNHLEVLPRHQTWQLLQNEVERRAIIETGLRSLLYGADPKMKEEIRYDLRNYPSVCSIDKAGKITTTPFPVPALAEITARV